MKLFEINEAIANIIDFETGEILDSDAYENLKMERKDKLTNIALLYKNMTSDAKQLKELEKEYSERCKRCEKTAEWCKETLAKELAGDKFEDEKKRFSISWRKSEKLIILDEKAISDEWIKTEIKYDIAGMKSAMKSGEAVSGVELIQNQSIQIK
jgi:Neuraminidase (sialidase)